MNEQQRASLSWDPFLADSLIYLSLAIGESLFTLSASLTYAYHYLMTLMK